MKKVFGILKPFDIALWCAAVTSITVAFVLAKNKDYMTLISSITGVTALQFIAKGHVAGQILTVVFSVLYGVVSYFFGYYGEMITYLGMSAPAAAAAVVSWLKHPYKDSKQVKIARLSPPTMLAAAVLSLVVTVAFYYILRALGTTNLIISSVSVTTSFFAAALVYLRSPYYGLAYSTNDIVLIVIWIMASTADIKYLPMVLCFSLFLVYDIYGFISWTAMRKKQDAPDTTENMPSDTTNL